MHATGVAHRGDGLVAAGPGDGLVVRIIWKNGCRKLSRFAGCKFKRSGIEGDPRDRDRLLDRVRLDQLADSVLVGSTCGTNGEEINVVITCSIGQVHSL